MNVLVISGEKTQNIVNSIGKCFSAGSVEFLVERDISGIERFFDAGRYFDRAVVIDYGISYNLEVGDAQAIRDRMNNFIQTIVRRSRNQPKLVFVCGTEAMADIVYQETMAVASHSKVLLASPPYNVSFMVNIVAKHLEELSQWGFEEYLAEKEKAEEAKKKAEPKKDTNLEIDGLDQLLQGGQSAQSRKRGAGAFTVSQRDLQSDGGFQSNLPGLGEDTGDSIGGFGDDEDDGWDDLPPEFEDDGGDEGEPGDEPGDDEDGIELELEDELPGTGVGNFGPGGQQPDEPSELGEPREPGDDISSWPTLGVSPVEQGSPLPDPGGLPGFNPSTPGLDTEEPGSDDTDSEDELPGFPPLSGVTQDTGDDGGIEVEGDWESQFEARQNDFNNPITSDDFPTGSDDPDPEPEPEDEQEDPGEELPGFDTPTPSGPPNLDFGNPEPEYGTPPGIDLFESYPSNGHEDSGDDSGMPEEFGSAMYTDRGQQPEPPTPEPVAPTIQPQAPVQKPKLFGRGKRGNQQPQGQGQGPNPMGHQPKQRRPQPQYQQEQFNQSSFDDLKTVLKTFKLRGHIISVTGTPSSGKTTLVANLADIANSLNCSVLMVDFDVNGRGLAYQSKMAYDAVHSIEVSRSFIREAVNGEAAIASRASILSPGQHLLTTGLASDMLGDDWTSPERLSRFCSMAKAQYQVILFDIPWDFAVGEGSKLLFNSDELVLTTGLNTHDLMNLMIRLCNVSDDALAEMLWSQGKLLFTKVRKTEHVLGRRVTGIRDILRTLDAQVESLLGEPAEYQFEDMFVSGQIPYDPSYESYWMAKAKYTADQGHYQLYTEALRKILIAD